MRERESVRGIAKEMERERNKEWVEALIHYLSCYHPCHPTSYLPLFKSSYLLKSSYLSHLNSSYLLLFNSSYLLKSIHNALYSTSLCSTLPHSVIILFYFYKSHNLLCATFLTSDTAFKTTARSRVDTPPHFLITDVS